jgi:hypothetical protein
MALKGKDALPFSSTQVFENGASRKSHFSSSELKNVKEGIFQRFP